MLKTTAIIVTYGDRFHLLEQVVLACFNEGVCNIIIVDNNSESQKQLKKLKQKYSNQIFIIQNHQNEGSARAFKQGLAFAKNNLDVDYIWTLDDDNKPQKNSLKYLKKYWRVKKDEVVCLLSYRPDRASYRDAILTKNPNLVLSSPNSFYGFNLLDKVKSFFIQKNEINETIEAGFIPYAPYGGMFFHISLLNLIGFPDEEFYLYSDDHDWSYRITKAGLKIELLLKSVVKDIDDSWVVTEEKKSIFSKIKESSSFRVYYTIRNRMVFEKRFLITNTFFYHFNLILFTIILFSYCGLSKQFRIFLLAIKDAKTNKLGKTLTNIDN